MLSDKSGLILFRLHDTKIYTNPETSDTALCHENSLGFSLVNISDSKISFDGGKQACITLSFLLGASSECLFPANTASADFGDLVAPTPFKVSQTKYNYQKENQPQIIFTIPNDIKFDFMPGQVLSFQWNRLITSTPGGYSTLKMTFPNTEDLDDVVLTQALYKECIYANIAQFYASPSAGFPGSRITLHWKVENASSGYIMPVGKDIFEDYKISCLDTTLTQNTHYYLDITNAHGNVYRETFAQLLPPSIAKFVVDSSGDLSWEVYYANEVRLKTGGEYIDIPATGHTSLDPAVTNVSIICTGLYTLERHMIIPHSAGIQAYCLDVWTFLHHQAATLTWQTSELSDTIQIIAMNSSCYTIDVPASGIYEQVYEQDLPIGFQLNYDGEKVFLCNSIFK